MDIKNAIYGRRSVRKYTSRIVSEDILNELVDVARWAPSNCNTQKTRVVLVKDQKIKQAIIDNGGAEIINSSPQGLMFFYDVSSDNIEYKDWIQSAAASIENVCLYAYSLGLGTCWVCHLPAKNSLRKIFSLPDNYDPIAYLLVGYPDGDPDPVPRKYDIADVWINGERQAHGNIGIKRHLRSCLRKVYYFLPVSFKRLINRHIDKQFVKKFKN
ncbi:MAG: nitroreductase family protein [Candidatus Omnitrophica bacterium]|jgi:nitroreductase|nr:nitroreductase family protein [Candidatus Omnitrophota bacterium]MDD5080548.1 nitroreductase family protein [Candidatus Omnitrophota bacterium]MDD5441149.1 nitroreductase family protein [Candidatus Omnitrophota bacterium]